MSTFPHGLPGGPLPDSSLFESRVDQSTSIETGVKDPKGKFYPFLEGEKFSLDKVGNERKAFVVKTSGARVSFEDWLKEISAEKITDFIYSYDAAQRVIIGPNNQIYKPSNIDIDTLYKILVEIRRDTSNRNQWPSDVAEKLTKLFLQMKKSKK